MRTKTTTIGNGVEYATVPERLKLFREACPNGKTETEPNFREDGMLEFTAWVWKDKSDYLEVLKAIGNTKESRGSADATGHALGKTVGVKAYEKIETIALGRALAQLGYMAGGSIASSEEMEAFQDYQKQQKEDAIQYAVESLNDCTNYEDLKEVFMSLGPLIKEKEIIDTKDKLKEKFNSHD
jgi:hypothetical protein